MDASAVITERRQINHDDEGRDIIMRIIFRSHGEEQQRRKMETSEHTDEACKYTFQCKHLFINKNSTKHKLLSKNSHADRFVFQSKIHKKKRKE